MMHETDPRFLEQNENPPPDRPPTDADGVPIGEPETEQASSDPMSEPPSSSETQDGG